MNDSNRNAMKLIHPIIFVLVLCATSCAKQNISTTTTIFLEAQYGYLGDRFARAYRAAPLPVALWEGTNLVAWLDTNYSSPTKEIIASRVLLHSRLAALFTEANSPEESSAQGAAALRWFSLIVTDHSFSAQMVVSNTLARDELKREYATQRK